MDARTKAIQAVIDNTVEGPVRTRAVAACGQLNTHGITFKLYLDGTKKQNEAVLKTLRLAGVIQQVTAAKPGIKPTYITTEDFRDAQNSSEKLISQMAEEMGATVEDDQLFMSEADALEIEDMYVQRPRDFASYEDAYKIVLGLQWDKPAGRRYEELVKEAKFRGVSFEGHIGDAVDSVCWTIAAFEEGVTLEDFPLEGRSHAYGLRTLRSGIAELKKKNLVRVDRMGGAPAIYRCTLWN